MRLPSLALICALAAASPALAHDGHRHSAPGADYPAGADLPPPPPPTPPGYDHDGPDYPGMYRPGPRPEAPRFDPRVRDGWIAQCQGHHRGDGPGPDCEGAFDRYSGSGYAQPGYGYAAPVIWVPVLRTRPCRETVTEEWVEERVPLRRRVIAPRRHVVVTDKRVRIVPDKRIRIVPDKLIPMK